MSSGVHLEEDTIALWGFDEPAEVPLANYATVTDDGPNGFDFTDATARPLIVGALGGVTIDEDGVITDGDYARWFDGVNDRHISGSVIGSTRAAELVAGPVRVQAWVNLYDTASAYTIVEVGGIGETDATNIILRLAVNASGFLTTFWESGSGTNRSAEQTTGATVPIQQWVHVAVVMTESGGTRTVDFYIDGNLEDSDSDPSPTGGASAVIGIGANVIATDFFRGRIGSIDIELTSDATEIATNAAATDTRFTGPTTNTWARFNFPEAPSVHDYGPHGLHLTPRSFLNSGHQYGALGVARSSLNSAHSTGGTGQGWETPTIPGFVAVMQGTSEWTLVMWYCPDAAEVSSDFFGVSTSAGETEGENNLLHVGLTGATRLMNVGWEQGAGNNVTDTSSAAMFGPADDRDAVMLAIVKESIGGGQSDVHLYRDGVLIETLPALTDPTGGDDFDVFVRLWNDPFGVGAFNFAVEGYLDRVHLISRVLEASELLEEYEAGGTLTGEPPPPPDMTPPVVSNVSPAALTNIEPTTEVSFDVTDETGLVCVMVYVLYPDLGDAELVHDGATYMPRFSSLSTRSPIVDGFRYTLRRSGGWKLAPGVARPNIDIRIRALDAAGNEAT